MLCSNLANLWRLDYTKKEASPAWPWLLLSIARLYSITILAAERLCTSLASSTKKVWVLKRTYSMQSASMMSHKLRVTFLQWTLWARSSTMSCMTTTRQQSGSKKHQKKVAHARSTIWASAMSLVTVWHETLIKLSNFTKKLQKKAITKACSIWHACTSTMQEKLRTRTNSKKQQSGSGLSSWKILEGQSLTFILVNSMRLEMEWQETWSLHSNITEKLQN